MAQHTSQEWKAIGVQVGRERGQLDHMTGIRLSVDKLWIPEGTDPAYAEGLRQGYLETVGGARPPLGV